GVTAGHRRWSFLFLCMKKKNNFRKEHFQMSIFSKLFRRKAPPRAVLEIDNEFTAFSGTAYGNAAFRSAVDAIARHAAKLQAHCKDSRLETVLQKTPNSYMSAYDLLYKTAAAYFTNNNAFLLLVRDEQGLVTAVYPIIPASVEFKPGTDGEIFLDCLFPDGRQVTFPYSDVIHLRRHFLSNDLSGETNAPLFPLLDTAQTLTQGISASVKNGTSIRGVLKFTSLVNPAQVKAEKDKFVADYFNPENSGGIAATDQRFDFVPTNVTAYNVPREQIEAVNGQIYDYLGVNAAIINGSYTEDEFSAFYESVIEPFAMQLSGEFALKCAADVVFTPERMEFSTADTKIKLLHEAAPLGVITINEARHLLALPPIDGGERRLQSLNYVSAEKADSYQLNESEENSNEETDKKQ
ncbi:MAG: phage portal protein, partial [Coriobacteriales bacterium]